MALRILMVAAALTILTASGCKTSSSNYQRPACAPAVVAVAPVAPACPQGQLPPPPVPVVVAPR